MVWHGRDERPLPTGMARLPGPTIVGAISYRSSPVGPYRELFVARPSRLGLRPGLTVTTMVVDSAGSRLAGRTNWGLPRELGTLEWKIDGHERVMTWRERGVTVRGQAARFALPMAAPVRTLQHRGDGPVLVPGRGWGRASTARIELHTAAGDDLATMAGAHRGVLVHGLGVLMQPARRPLGLLSTLRAPATAAEPTIGFGPALGDR